MPRTRPTVWRDVVISYEPMARERRAANISQRELGVAIGGSRQTIYRIERGKTEPSHRTMLAIARALGVPVQTLSNVLPTE
jgi:transcriptional regulator with XRE-family HTH domain